MGLMRTKQVKLNLSTADITVILKKYQAQPQHPLTFPFRESYSILLIALLHDSKIKVLRQSSKRLLKCHFNDALKRNIVFLKTVLSRKLLATHTTFPSCHDRPPWAVSSVCYIKNYITSKTRFTLHLNSLKGWFIMYFTFACLFLISVLL